MIASLWRTKSILRFALYAIPVLTVAGYFVIGQNTFGVALVAFMFYIAYFYFLVLGATNAAANEGIKGFAAVHQLAFEDKGVVEGLPSDLLLRNWTTGNTFDSVMRGTMDACEICMFSFVYEPEISEHTKYINVFRLHTTKTFPRVMLNGSYASEPVGVPPGLFPLVLEGNFNKFFSVYTPSGAEVPVLQLFTPDLMQWFIDTEPHVVMDLNGKDIYLYVLGRIEDEGVLTAFFDHATAIAGRITHQLR